MDRERELKIIRPAYAKQVTAAAGEPGDHLEAVEPAGPPGAAAGHDRPLHGAPLRGVVSRRADGGSHGSRAHYSWSKHSSLVFPQFATPRLRHHPLATRALPAHAPYAAALHRRDPGSMLIQKFARDSALEQRGFELPVPDHKPAL
jgi:hypothetical protein